MKNDWEDRLRGLFEELKHGDERSAPSFQAVWNPALRRSESHTLSWRPAMAMITLIGIAVCSALVLLYFNRSSKSVSDAPVDQTTVVVKEYRRETDESLPQQKPARLPAKRSRKSPPPLISEWRSPTEFLLKTSGDELIKSTPRIGESLIIVTPETRERN